MLEAVQNYVRSLLRFPKRSTPYLHSMRTSGIVIGIAWLVIALVWADKLRVLLVIFSLGWLLQAALVHREIRRRKGDSIST